MVDAFQGGADQYSAVYGRPQEGLISAVHSLWTPSREGLISAVHSRSTASSRWWANLGGMKKMEFQPVLDDKPTIELRLRQ